jgi:hypothetical protein
LSAEQRQEPTATASPAACDPGAAHHRTSVKRHGKMPQRALFAWTAALRGHNDAKPVLAATTIVH